MRNYSFAFLAAGLVMVSATAPAAFVINEVDSDTPGGDAAEFVELKGNPNEAATSLTLVFYNGLNAANATPRLLSAIDLSTCTADLNGYLLIGNPDVAGADYIVKGGTVQNGEDAVAIYNGPSTGFALNSAPSSVDLVDFLVYRTNTSAQSADWSGFGTSMTPANEAQYGSVTLRSIARIPDGTGSFDAADPTPKAANSQSATISVTSDLDFVRFNQYLAASPTTKTLTLRNNGMLPVDVTDLSLDASTSAVFTVVSGPDPAVPVTLAYNESTTMVVQFFESDLSANRVYGGMVNYATNADDGTGTVPLSAELVLATNTGTPGSIKINEICYQPSSAAGQDYNNDGQQVGQDDEFVELVNMTDQPINIEGWENPIVNSTRTTTHTFVFPAGATIPANGFVTVFSHGNPTGFDPGTAFTFVVARIFNPGSFVSLSDGVTDIDAVAYSDAEDTPDADGFTNMGVTRTGGSIGRRPDGTDNFRAFAHDAPVVEDRPTPNASNNGATAAGDWSLFE